MNNHYILLVNSLIKTFSILDAGASINFGLTTQYSKDLFSVLKKGDLVLGYIGTPIDRVRYIFKIEEIENDYQVKLTKKLEVALGATIDDISLSNNIAKNDLVAISEDIYNDLFHKMTTELNLEPKNNKKSEDSMDDESFKDCLGIFRTPRINNVFPLNFIVYGAPGTGKTYSMVEYALAIINNQPIEEFRKANTDRKANVFKYKEYVKNGQIVFTTFHQNYGYEEFIQGLRPDTESETLSFKTIDGVFKKIADTALRDEEDKNYIIIIDEINRANISKVFGELITLIEDDKRWGELNEMSATLQFGDNFAVPNNLYIVGTMNSADKSISLIDAALRRRFAFIEQRPESKLVKDSTLKTILEKLNELLVKELDSTDLLIGHSYFIGKSKNDLTNIMNNSIIPLLYEYFYDNKKKVATVLKETIDGTKVDIEIVDDKVGRLRVKKKV